MFTTDQIANVGAGKWRRLEQLLERRQMIGSAGAEQIAEAWQAKEAARAQHEHRVAAYQAQLRGESAPTPPSAAALRQRRSRAARRAKADATSPASRSRTRTAPRPVAARQ